MSSTTECINDTGKCSFCSNDAKYTCPQCNLEYCSSTCYKHSRHVKCSENFYKKLVEEQLKGATASPESKQKMEEILRRAHQEGIEEGDNNLDSDDDDDLGERIKGIDLNDSEAVWSKLSQSEQQEFLSLVREGKTDDLIPEWEPWWEQNSLIKEVVEDSSKNDPPWVEQCPPILECPPLSQITKSDPATCIPSNILNVLASYVWIVRIFNGDHQENCVDASEAILTLCPVLSAAANFSSSACAISAVKMEAQNHSWLRESEEFSSMVSKDVQKILEGPTPSSKSFYVASALSDLHCVLSSCRKTLSCKKRKDRPGGFQSAIALSHQEIEKKIVKPELIRNCVKKIEYFLSYVKEYPYKL